MVNKTQIVVRVYCVVTWLRGSSVLISMKGISNLADKQIKAKGNFLNPPPTTRNEAALSHADTTF